MFGEVFHTFSSIPHVAKAVQRVVTRLFNPTTGQSYSSSSEGQADVPEVDAGSKETPRAHVCGECFNCKVRAQPPPPAHTRHTHTCFKCDVARVPTADTGAQGHLHAGWNHLRLCLGR